MKKVLISFALSWFLLSCSKEEISQSSPNIEIVSGILKFESRSHFEEFQKSLEKNTLSKEELHLIDSFQSFEREVKKELTNQEKENIVKNNGSNVFFLNKSESSEIEAVPQIKNPILRKLLNKNGLVLLGNDALKVEFEREITFQNFDPKSDVIFNNYSNFNSSVKANSRNGKVKSINSALPQNDSRHDYLRSDLRLKVRYDYDGSTPNPNYWNKMEIWGELQDRLAGVWWNRTADVITISSNFRNGVGNSSAANNNSVYLEAYNIYGIDYEFGKDNYHHFDATATCIENGGQYIGDVTVSR